MQPEVFKTAPSEDEQREYSSAILFGYQEMDRLLGRMLQLVGDQAVVILATALSQQPCLLFEEKGGKHGYYVKDYAQLLKFAGVTHSFRIAPVMSGQFWIYLDNESDAIDVQARLAALRVDGENAVRTRRENASVFTSCCIFRDLARDSALRLEGSEQSAPFFSLLMPMRSSKAGCTIPTAFFWHSPLRQKSLGTPGKRGPDFDRTHHPPDARLAKTRLYERKFPACPAPRGHDGDGLSSQKDLELGKPRKSPG